MDTYVYQIGSSLYVNLTNRCSNHCLFYSLWLKEGEPTAEQIIQSIGNPSAYREIVFCGYGEPTYRLDVMLAVCKYVHDCRGKTRLNTNGHGNLINGRNIAPERRDRQNEHFAERARRRGLRDRLPAHPGRRVRRDDRICARLQGGGDKLLVFGRGLHRRSADRALPRHCGIGRDSVAHSGNDPLNSLKNKTAFARRRDFLS